MTAKLRNCRRDEPKFMGYRHCTFGILAHSEQFHAQSVGIVGYPHDESSEWLRRHDAKDIGFGLEHDRLLRESARLSGRVARPKRIRELSFGTWQGELE
jgi:hypothetical protein